jgi:hypothetical protein
MRMDPSRFRARNFPQTKFPGILYVDTAAINAFTAALQAPS